MTNHTDLAARFEAKREECEKLQRAAFADGRSTDGKYWFGRAVSYEEARDMARAGAAGGAGDLAELADIRAMLLAGQGDDDGMQILPDLTEDMSALAMVASCVHLLEKRRDIVECAGSAAIPTPARQSYDLRPGVIARVMDEDGGWWSSCAGCHETVDGHETGHYPWSEIFRCHVGSGCTDCGGLGVTWSYFTDEQFAEMQEELSPPPAQQGFSPPLSQVERSCTCHPDDNPPQPCPERYAYSECVKTASPPLAAERVALLPIADWAAAVAQDARLKMADLPSGSETHAWFHAQAVAFEAAYDHAAAVAAAAPPPPAQQGSSSDHE